MVVFYPKKNLFDFGANGSVDIRLCLSSLADTRMNEYDLASSTLSLMNLIFWGSDKFLQSLLRALFDCRHVQKSGRVCG